MTRPTILVAEDDARFRIALAVRLEHEGYRVVQAVDGESAVALAQKESPDVLMLDVHMPKSDGFKGMDEIDKIEALRNRPVIYMTGDSSDDVNIAAERRGAFWVFKKPVPMDELLALLDLLIGKGALPDSDSSQSPSGRSTAA